MPDATVSSASSYHIRIAEKPMSVAWKKDIARSEYESCGADNSSQLAVDRNPPRGRRFRNYGVN